MVATTSSVRTIKSPLVYAGDEQTEDPITTEKQVSGGTVVKVKDTLEGSVDVKPSRMERFEKLTIDAYDFFGKRRAEILLFRIHF